MSVPRLALGAKSSARVRPFRPALPHPPGPPRGGGYDAPARYFVTWCTAHRWPVLGRVLGGAMRLSPLGAVVQNQVVACLHPDVHVEAYAVMPGHVHVLLRLHGGVLLGHAVRHLKSGATRTARREGLWGPEPLWQTRFWDVIVRTDAHADRVRAFAHRPRAHSRVHPPKTITYFRSSPRRTRSS